MFNRKTLTLIALAATVSLTGCGGKKEAETEKPAADVSEEMSESAEALEAITPSDYLVKNVSDYITLGNLDDLSATQTVYDVTDEMVQERIQDELYSYSEENEVDHAAEAGNTVYADVTATVAGEAEAEPESTFFTIGDADYGEEFDQQLTGASTGDELSFSVTYGDDAWYDEWVNQTVDFKVTVTGVYETVVPEYDDAFVSEYTGYETKSEYEDSIRETILSEYEEDSYTGAVNTLFQEAMAESTYNGYPEELYTLCEDEILSYYGQFIGESDTSAILDALGISQADLDSDVMNSVNLRLLISAICEEKGIELTEEEYVDEVTAAAEDYGYASAAEYEAAGGRESIVWSLYENKVAEYLYDTATITPEEAGAEDETDLIYEEEGDELSGEESALAGIGAGE